MAAKTSELGAMLDAWDKETGSGRDDEYARELARSYVDAHPDEFADLKGLSTEELVSRIDRLRSVAANFREGDMEDEALAVDAKKLLVDTYILATVAKQFIGGTVGGPLADALTLPENG